MTIVNRNSRVPALATKVKSPVTHTEGTNGRVYGGAKSLVHIPDGNRAEVGARIAEEIDTIIRARSNQCPDVVEDGKLCPGCYMIALFNAAIALADANGQPRRELGRTLSAAFAKLAERPNSGTTEEINVLVDPE